MTGLSLFLLGTVAISNIGLVLYLMLDKNRHVDSKGTENSKDVPETGTTPEITQSDFLKKSCVGKSRFDVDKFDSDIDKRIDSLEHRLDRTIMLLDRMVGDVRLEDVEFAQPEDNEQSENVAPALNKGLSENSARMTPEQAAASFNDVRIEDVETDMVSAPSASGASMDDIEHSLSTAVNPDATDEEKAKAGRILEKLMDTNLMERIASIEEIQKGVMSCVNEYNRESIAGRPAKKAAPAPKRKSRAFIAENFDDFNPADLLK